MVSLNPFGCVSNWFGLLHDFTIWEGFNELRISGLNPIGSFSNLRIKWSTAKHCETTTLIVLIILNKLDLANVSLKRLCWWKNKSDSANLWFGGVFEKRWQITHLSRILIITFHIWQGVTKLDLSEPKRRIPLILQNWAFENFYRKLSILVFPC